MRDHVREITVAGVTLIADAAGALYWPEEKLLVAADLHLEKGSAYAARGVLLPPYDTAATLARLAHLIERYAPAPCRGARRQLSRRRRTGAHGRQQPRRADGPAARPRLGLARRQSRSRSGRQYRRTFRRDAGARRADVSPRAVSADAGASDGEIAGHLHPLACIVQRGRALRRRCFAGDGRRLVMPAFGSYAGGLNVRHRAIASLFPALALHGAYAGRTAALRRACRALSVGLELIRKSGYRFSEKIMLQQNI